MSNIKQKNVKFHQELVSAEKRKVFESNRKRLLEAQLNDQKIEEWEAAIELMKMFETREDYEQAMKIYDQYEKDRIQYQESIEKMEEDSTNHENMIKQKEYEKKKKRYQELFGEQFTEEQ